MRENVVRQVVGAVAAIGMIGGIVGAQVPEKRARSEQRIPTQKEVPEQRARSDERIPFRKEVPEKPAGAAVVVPGKNMVVYAPPIVTHLVRSESGSPIVLVERAPTIGAGVSWLPLLGLLGGAALIGTLGSHNGGAENAQTTPPVTPPVTPPPPVTPTPPVTPPPTVVPEPGTMALLATGLAGGFAMIRRRRRA